MVIFLILKGFFGCFFLFIFMVFIFVNVVSFLFLIIFLNMVFSLFKCGVLLKRIKNCDLFVFGFLFVIEMMLWDECLRVGWILLVKGLF